MYQGHLNDGSSIQKHSVGGMYPCIVYAQETCHGLKYGLITPDNQDGSFYDSYDKAVAAGILWIQDNNLAKALGV